MKKIDLMSLSIDEISMMLADFNEPGYRGKQIFEWLHKKQVTDIDSMSDLSKNLRDKLKETCVISGLEIVEKKTSSDGSTTKYLFAFDDGNTIESVLMKYSYGNAACISTQVGCGMACTFCASAIGGLVRNLSGAEMLNQIYAMQKDSERKISGVVLMGSGEPLDNYDNVLKFLSMVNSENGINLGMRHITLSTCGLADNIYRLADENLQITLAVSLHAPNDVIRNKIMPVSKKYPMESLFKACRYYAEKTKRRITFEYALIDGVNDDMAHARELAGNLKKMLCHVNLIPINNVKERKYKKSRNTAMFAKVLAERGIETTIRRELGSDINAACGQLRKGYTDKNRFL